MYKRHNIWDEDKWDIHSTGTGGGSSGYAGHSSKDSKEDYHKHEIYNSSKDEDKTKDVYQSVKRDGEDKQKKLAELAEKKQSVKYFLIDEDGVVGKEVPPENLSLSNLWLVYDRGFGELKNNQQLVDRAWLDKLKLIIQTLKEQLNLTTIYFALPSIESNELYAKIKPDASEVSVSWFIYLNLDLDLVKTLTDFQEVYRSKIINQPEEAVTEYIDLRIANKIFWF